MKINSNSNILQVYVLILSYFRMCHCIKTLFFKNSEHAWVQVCEMIIRGTHQNALGLIEIISNRISVAAGSLDHPDSERSVSCYE